MLINKYSKDLTKIVSEKTESTIHGSSERIEHFKTSWWEQEIPPRGNSVDQHELFLSKKETIIELGEAKEE